jgi:glycyl-tRNA synthetase
MAEIEHFVDPDEKSHPRFEEIKHVVMPLYSKENQMAACGAVSVSMGEAVKSVFLVYILTPGSRGQ